MHSSRMRRQIVVVQERHPSYQKYNNPEHEVAAIILQQTDCLQCGKHWKSPNGLNHHEKTVHEETRSSRMDTFQPFLQQSFGKCLSMMASKLWFMNSSLYTWRSINPVIAARIGQSTAQCVGSDPTKLDQLQRSPAIGRLYTCGSSTAAMAAWTGESTAQYIGSVAAELVELQRSSALGRSYIYVFLDTAITAWTQRYFPHYLHSNPVRLARIRIPPAVVILCYRGSFNTATTIRIHLGAADMV